MRRARRSAAILISVVTAIILFAATAATITKTPSIRPLNNDASAGRVTFTFDDGPSKYDTALIAKLKQLHIPAVFFVIGVNVKAYSAVLCTEYRDGYTIGNHTYDHPDFTGAPLGTPPITVSKATTELTQDNNAIIIAGVPKPTLWRPPYGDVNIAYANVANSLGLRLVMPWGDPNGGNIVDSQDWRGISAAQIVRNVAQGYTSNWYTGPQHFPGIRAGSIIAMHDGGEPAHGYVAGANTVNTIASLQGIVDYMNAHHLGATVVVRPDATGNILSFTH